MNCKKVIMLVNVQYLRIVMMISFILGMAYILKGEEYFHLFTTGLAPSVILLIIGLLISHYPAKASQVLLFVSRGRLLSELILEISIMASFAMNIITEYRNNFNSYFTLSLPLGSKSIVVANTMALLDVVMNSFILIWAVLMYWQSTGMFLKLKDSKMHIPPKIVSNMDLSNAIGLIVFSFIILSGWSSKFSGIKTPDVLTLMPGGNILGWIICFAMVTAWVETWFVYLVNDNPNAFLLKWDKFKFLNVIEAILVAVANSFHIASVTGLLISARWISSFQNQEEKKKG